VAEHAGVRRRGRAGRTEAVGVERAAELRTAFAQHRGEKFRVLGIVDEDRPDMVRA